MKVCKRCGCETIDDNAQICDECGGELIKIRYKNPPVYKPEVSKKEINEEEDFQYLHYGNNSNYYNQNYSYQSRPDDYGGIGWILLGLIVSPIVALILYLVLKQDYPNRASDIGKGAIIGILIYVVLFTFIFCSACLTSWSVPNYK